MLFRSRAVTHRNRFLADDVRVLVEHDVPDLVRLVAAIGDRVHLVGEGVVMRVRGISADQRAVERVVRDRVQLVTELDRLSDRLDHREGSAGGAEYIGVWRVLWVVFPAWGEFRAET